MRSAVRLDIDWMSELETGLAQQQMVHTNFVCRWKLKLVAQANRILDHLGMNCK